MLPYNSEITQIPGQLLQLATCGPDVRTSFQYTLIQVHQNGPLLDLEINPCVVGYCKN